MMELRSLKTLQLLEEISKSRPTSQRELSQSLEISLGLVNSFIQKLVKKGYCKVTTIPKRKVKYLLTPSGAMEKTRLTYEYIATSYHYYKAAAQKVQTLYSLLQHEGKHNLIFYGAGELAEIALHCMGGTELRLVGIVDPTRKGANLNGHAIGDCSLLKVADYDVILVTATDRHKDILDEISSVDVPSSTVRFFE